MTSPAKPDTTPVVWVGAEGVTVDGIGRWASGAVHDVSNEMVEWLLLQNDGFRLYVPVVDEPKSTKSSKSVSKKSETDA